MDWICDGCGRHYSFSQNECLYCKYNTIITTGGALPSQVSLDISKCLCETCKQIQCEGLICSGKFNAKYIVHNCFGFML